MDLALLGSLAVLALIDSTSFGTLLIPIWLLMAPGDLRPRRIVVFLGTVAAFYFVIGLAIALGADALLPLLETRPVTWLQLIAGVALFFLSFRLDNKKTGPGPRMIRWRERAGTDRGMVALALTAAAAEVTTMLPYLAAIGLLTHAGLAPAPIALVMAGYCLLMIAPALLLLAIRLAAGDRLTPLLKWVDDRLSQSNALAWVVGIVGFLLAQNAAGRLF